MGVEQRPTAQASLAAAEKKASKERQTKAAKAASKSTPKKKVGKMKGPGGAMDKIPLDLGDSSDFGVQLEQLTKAGVENMKPVREAEVDLHRKGIPGFAARWYSLHDEERGKVMQESLNDLVQDPFVRNLILQGLDPQQPFVRPGPAAVDLLPELFSVELSQMKQPEFMAELFKMMLLGWENGILPEDQENIDKALAEQAAAVAAAAAANATEEGADDATSAPVAKGAGEAPVASEVAPSQANKLAAEGTAAGAAAVAAVETEVPRELNATEKALKDAGERMKEMRFALRSAFLSTFVRLVISKTPLEEALERIVQAHTAQQATAEAANPAAAAGAEEAAAAAEVPVEAVAVTK